MRSSSIKSPHHSDIICDISVESIVQLYTKSNQLFKSDLFSFFIENILYVNGSIFSNSHYTDNEIITYIKSNIQLDLTISLNINKKQYTEIYPSTNSNTFIGYYCNENLNGIPFEHEETLKLANHLYNFYKIPFNLCLTINGSDINIMIESSENKDDLRDLAYHYLQNKKIYSDIKIDVSNLISNGIHKSGMNTINMLYGPRIPYGNLNYVGLDISNNHKYAHLLSREIAKYCLIEYELNYCLVELTYHINKQIPIQLGVKGNRGGIHIENGTFFITFDDLNLFNQIQTKLLNNIKSHDSIIVDIVKKGISEIDNIL